MPQISIITPAFHSQTFIRGAVESALAQTFTDWEMIIIADDGEDYEALFKAQGLNEKRLRFVSSGGMATGVSHARNIGLAAAQADVVALLDSDDFFFPKKLEKMLPPAKEYGICSCGIRYVTFDEDGAERELRHYNPLHREGKLQAKDYPFVNYSGNAMVLFDRTRIPYGWDETLLVMEDLVFAMKAYDFSDVVYHIAEPLHGYVKRSGSLCNSGNTSEQFIAAKKRILQLIDNGKIDLHQEQARTTLRAFLSISLQAEEEFSQLLKKNPAAAFSEFLLSKIKDAGLMDAI